MILRSLELARFGCFTDRTFEFRRGLNLVTGPNESGKTTLAAAVSSVLFGVPNPERFCPPGERRTCAATLVLEQGQASIRLTRDLLTGQVILEERDEASRLRDQFRGHAPAGGGESLPTPFRQKLAALFPFLGDSLTEAEFRFLLGDPEMTGERGFLRVLAGLAETSGKAPPGEQAGSGTGPKMAELEQARADFARGRRYLDWARSQWSLLEASAVPETSASPPPTENSERQAELLREYAKTGLPNPLPDELPALLDEVAAIRRELVEMNAEAAVLAEDLRGLPRPPWIAAVSLVLLAAGAAGLLFWLEPTRLLTALGAAGAVTVGVTAWMVWKWSRLRAGKARLHARELALELRRDEAQSRLSGLDGKFERLGVSPSPVAVARMQKNLERGRQILAELASAGGFAPPAVGVPSAAVPANLLPREEIPDAEARLGALGEKIRALEKQLAEDSNGSAAKEPFASPLPEVPGSGPGGAFSGQSPVRPFSSSTVAEESSRILRLLTGGRYGELALNPEATGLLLRGSEGWLAPEQVGQSARSAAVLALRLALLRRVPGGQALPLILDEPFAAFDRGRLGEALKILERLGGTHQIVLCSHDDLLVKRGSRERWHLIPLAETPGTSMAPTDERMDDGGQLHLL